MRIPRLRRTLVRLTAAAAPLGLLLVGGSTAATADTNSGDSLASFEAANAPGQYIRHRNALGEISRIDTTLDRADATWVLRPALSGTPGAVSFESINYPGTFLRHQSFRV